VTADDARTRAIEAVEALGIPEVWGAYAAAVVDAVEPFIRADEREQKMAAADIAFLDDGEWRSARADKVLDLPKSTYFYQVGEGQPSELNLRAAYPWADSIEERDGKTVVTKGKVSFGIEKVESITPDETAFEAEYGRKPTADEQIGGEYHKGKIRVSKAGDNWTLQHEYYHLNSQYHNTQTFCF
jgi:hypothetical protein